VALIVGLAITQRDPDTPPGLADMLAVLEARAQAVLVIKGIVGLVS
jgi:hypothetical protein